MEVSGRLHDPARERSPVSIKQEGGWDPQDFQFLSQKTKGNTTKLLNFSKKQISVIDFTIFPQNVIQTHSSLHSKKKSFNGWTTNNASLLNSDLTS